MPTDPTYGSLNLSQAVLLCCYELFGALGTYEPPVEKSQPGKMIEVVIEVGGRPLSSFGCDGVSSMRERMRLMCTSSVFVSPK